MKKQRGDAVLIVILLIVAVEAAFYLNNKPAKTEGEWTPYNDIHRYEEKNDELPTE